MTILLLACAGGLASACATTTCYPRPMCFWVGPSGKTVPCESFDPSNPAPAFATVEQPYSRVEPLKVVIDPAASACGATCANADPLQSNYSPDLTGKGTHNEVTACSTLQSGGTLYTRCDAIAHSCSTHGVLDSVGK